MSVNKNEISHKLRFDAKSEMGQPSEIVLNTLSENML